METMAEVSKPLTLQTYIDDITHSVNYVKDTLGQDTEITLVGYSFLASFVLAYDNINPGKVKNLIIINPYWIKKYGPDDYGTRKDSSEIRSRTRVSMKFMINRLLTAPPEGLVFRENLWLDEAKSKYSEYTTSYDPLTETWYIPKRPDSIIVDYLLSNFTLPRLKANILMIGSQYDSETPSEKTQHFFDTLLTENKEFRILPDATHLCIWEKARHTLYEWTADFILKESFETINV
jgi:pimeloyl-ACP methyl ester carboxylesterase